MFAVVLRDTDEQIMNLSHLAKNIYNPVIHHVCVLVLQDFYFI